MADPICGDVLFECCVGGDEAWFAMNDEKLSVGKADRKRENPAAKSGRASQLDGDRIEGTIPSGEYQRRMGELYRVGVSGASPHNS